MFFSTRISTSTTKFSEAIPKLAQALQEADAVVVGAGAGLSTAAGMTYSGERFERYFADFEQRFGFHDMYSGGFYPFPDEQMLWGYWSRQIWANRYAPGATLLYKQLAELLKGRDYFVLTTNVDHQFQLAGIDKHRLFYTQGDYGLFQCSEPCHQQTYDNEERVRAMVAAQLEDNTDQAGATQLEQTNEQASAAPSFPADKGSSPITWKTMRIPRELVPHCPVCGKPMSMNLRCDNTFVEDAGWHAAAERYHEFLRRHEGMRVLYLELGVGGNTPGIIKYPFWQYTAANPRAAYACVNLGEACCPAEIDHQSILLDAGADSVIPALLAHSS